MTSKEIRDYIRIGCTAADVHLTCSYPACTCKQIPAAIMAVLYETNKNKVSREQP